MTNREALMILRSIRDEKMRVKRTPYMVTEGEAKAYGVDDENIRELRGLGYLTAHGTLNSVTYLVR